MVNYAKVGMDVTIPKKMEKPECFGSIRFNGSSVESILEGEEYAQL